ncbi:Alpha/beta hydrolase fold-1 [Daldinia bambusicola]|nr:Alpha/beta hydrolase fold-1 [Daldinia bambusicola]
MATPTILFVPGAAHEPWVFDDVRDALSKRGFETDAAALATASSGDATLGLYADVAAIRSALVRLIDAGKEVVLVAHSYGGMVASNAVEGLGIKQRAAEGKAGGVIIILYLSAFALPVGVSLMMSFQNKLPDWWIPTEDNKFLTPIKTEEHFYHDVEPSLTAKAVAGLKPMPMQMLLEESRYSPLNEGFDVGYIFLEDDKALVMDAQRAMFSQFPAGSFSASLYASHSPFLSMPAALADTIRDSISHVRGKNSE